MLTLIRRATAGTLESSDVFVEAAPGGEALTVTLDSAVKEQFGASIEASAREVAAALGVTAGEIRLIDRGALDCVIRARVETALLRAAKEETL